MTSDVNPPVPPPPNTLSIQLPPDHTREVQNLERRVVTFAKRTIVRCLAPIRSAKVALAVARAAFMRHPLPPGELVPIERLERSNQRFLLEQSERLGPIFKVHGGRTLLVCVVGIPLCRRFLKENSEHVTPATVKLESLFPRGFLRKMHGDEHAKYRKALLRAIDPQSIPRCEQTLDQITHDALDRYASAHREGPLPPNDFIRALDDIATGQLLHLCFGAEYRTESYDSLMRQFRRLGPEGFEWYVGRREREAFVAIRETLRKQCLDHARADTSANSNDEWSADSILARLQVDRALDETMLGNLIYMVEMGRHDVYSLFRWLTKYATEDPLTLQRLADKNAASSNGGLSRADAFVMETLRMAQSERLIRTVNRDLVFEGFSIPKSSTVRLCTWESHKAPEAFAEPFAFHAERFLQRDYTREEYAPFGMDHHSCPFGHMSVMLGSMFLRSLASAYTLEPMGDGPAVRARYHWHPAREFTVRVRRKGGDPPRS